MNMPSQINDKILILQEFYRAQRDMTWYFIIAEDKQVQRNDTTVTFFVTCGPADSAMNRWKRQGRR